MPKHTEEEIREHWERSSWKIKRDLYNGYILKVPYRNKNFKNWFEGCPPVSSIELEYLEFRYETGFYNGIPSWRIVCENVVVEQGVN